MSRTPPRRGRTWKSHTSSRLTRNPLLLPKTNGNSVALPDHLNWNTLLQLVESQHQPSAGLLVVVVVLKASFAKEMRLREVPCLLRRGVHLFLVRSCGCHCYSQMGALGDSTDIWCPVEGYLFQLSSEEEVCRRQVRSWQARQSHLHMCCKQLGAEDQTWSFSLNFLFYKWILGLLRKLNRWWTRVPQIHSKWISSGYLSIKAHSGAIHSTHR